MATCKSQRGLRMYVIITESYRYISHAAAGQDRDTPMTRFGTCMISILDWRFSISAFNVAAVLGKQTAPNASSSPEPPRTPLSPAHNVQRDFNPQGERPDI